MLTPRVVIGFGIAIVGFTLTLDRLRLVDADRILRYWPVALMAVGALMIAQADDPRGRTRGVVFTAIGAWVFLGMQGWLRVSIWELFWPVMLIIIGLSLAFQTARRDNRFSRGSGPRDSSARLSTFSVWSSCKRTSNASPFRGGDITAIMGGAQIDLRTAVIPPGEEATLDIVTVMGGVEIFVPDTWQILTPIVPFMGAVEDRRLPSIDRTPKDSTTAPRLVIRGFVMMGGVHLKS